MPPRKAQDHGPYRATYNQDDVPRDKASTKMIGMIDILAAQMARTAKLLTERHPTPECKHKLGERAVAQCQQTMLTRIRQDDAYFNSIAIDVNVQVYTTSNKVMNIQDRPHKN